MTAGGIYNQKTQDPSSDSTVVFQAVLVTVDVVGSNGGAVSGADARYYANGWHSIGATGADGAATVELLPAAIPFAASLGSASAQVTANTGADSFVTIKLAVAGAAPPAAHASIEFVSATDTEVTWRFWPSAPANLYFWDDVDSCTPENGADCGSMTSGGFGRTRAVPVATSALASASGQSFLVTQSYKKDGDSCSVTNTVTYGASDDQSGAKTVTGSYKCSGTPALGWPLLGVFFVLGVLGAGVVARRLAMGPRA